MASVESMKTGLTDREEIAMRILTSHKDLITVNMDHQREFIENALDFADYFLDISRGNE